MGELFCEWRPVDGKSNLRPSISSVPVHLFCRDFALFRNNFLGPSELVRACDTLDFVTLCYVVNLWSVFLAVIVARSNYGNLLMNNYPNFVWPWPKNSVNGASFTKVLVLNISAFCCSVHHFLFLACNSYLTSVARGNYEITPPNLPKVAKFHATVFLVENSHFLLKLGPT